MSRSTTPRRFGAGAVAFAVALSLAACGNSAASGPSKDFDTETFPDSIFQGLKGELTWYDSSGGLTAKAKDETVWKNFTDLTGVRSRAEFTDGTATKFRAAAESGNVPWNLIEFGTGAEFIQARDAGLLAKIDTSVVPVDDLDPADVDPYGIRVEANGAVLTWNKDAFKGEQPSSPADLFDTEKFPGKRCLYKFPISAGTLEVALVADGVAPEDVYPLDADRAFKKLETIKDDIVWWDSGSTVIQLLNNGECAMGMVWSGRVFDAIEKQKLPLDFTWTNGLFTAAYFAVPKDAPQPAVGQAAISMWVKDLEGQKGFVDKTTYTTGITALTADDYAADVRPFLAEGDNLSDGIITEDPEYLSKNVLDLSKRLASFSAQ